MKHEFADLSGSKTAKGPFRVQIYYHLLCAWWLSYHALETLEKCCSEMFWNGDVVGVIEWRQGNVCAETKDLRRGVRGT